MQVFGSDNIAFNPCFEFCDFIQKIGRNRSRKNERLQVLAKLIEQFAVSRDAAGLDQRHAFPGLTIPGIIVFHAVKRANKRTLAALWPQPDVDSEKRISGCGENLDNLFRKPSKKFVIGKAGIDVSVIAVKENKIDVGTVVQLASSKLPHSQNAKACLRMSPFFCEMLETGRLDFVNKTFSGSRDVTGRLGEPGEPCDLAETDSQHFLRFPGSQFPE